MRLCQIMLAPRFGGAERYFVDLSRALAQRGHEVLAVCRRGAQCAGELQGLARLRVVEIPVAGAWDPFAVRRVKQHVRDFQPAVAHAHLARAAHIAGKALAATGIALVAKTHNYVNLKYYRRVDMFIPTTADQRAYLKARGVDEGRIHLIPNFSALQPVSHIPAATLPIHLVAVGRMVPKKGFAVLLDALARLAAAGRRVHLRLGGDGPELDALRSKARDLGLEQLVRFEGWRADVPGFFCGAALFVLPSLDEPFGITLLEAMASGVPIVSTLTQGPREFLDEACAWLVAPNDAAALAQAIAGALDDSEERHAKAQRAVERFTREFSADVVVPKIEALYERLARH